MKKDAEDIEQVAHPALAGVALLVAFFFLISFVFVVLNLISVGK